MKKQHITIVLPFEYTIGEKGHNIGRSIETPYDAAQEALEELSNGVEMPEVHEDVKYDLSVINWEELKSQKLLLLKAIDNTNSEKIADALTGICSLIDDIQDHAVNVMGINENTVFNLSEDDEDKLEASDAIDSTIESDMFWEDKDRDVMKFIDLTIDKQLITAFASVNKLDPNHYPDWVTIQNKASELLENTYHHRLKNKGMLKYSTIINKAISDAIQFMEKRTDCFYSDVELQTKSKNYSDVNKRHLYFNKFVEVLKGEGFKIFS
jgi:hypothetical protein